MTRRNGTLFLGMTENHKTDDSIKSLRIELKQFWNKNLTSYFKKPLSQVFRDNLFLFP